MRKFLLSTITLMMSVAMLAVGTGDGTSKANAIDFDWADGHKPAMSAGSWYRVGLSPLKAEANDPTLALYLTNLTDATATVKVTVEASLLGQSSTSTLNYNIAGKDYQLWSKKSFNAAGRELSLKQMMDLGLSEIYLQLTANQEIALSAKVYETEEIVDDACSKAKDFDWAGVSVAAGEQWYRMNLAEVKNADKKLNFVITNDGGAAANVAFDMSLDCPASAVIEKDWVIGVGAEQTDEFGRVFLDVLKEDWVYLKLTNDQPITLRVEEEVVVVDPDQYTAFNSAAVAELAFDTELHVGAGAHVYKVLREDLIAGRGYAAEFYATNLTSNTANLKVETAFAYPVKSAVEQNLTIGANETVVKGIKGGMLDAVTSEWVYICLTADQDMSVTVGMRNTDPCAYATPFDWSTGGTQAAGTTEWYALDIASLKQDKQHLYLEFTNHANAMALLNVEVALDCQGTRVPLTLPLPANLNVGQTIDYQLLSRAPLNTIYIGVTTDSDIELEASTINAIAADQTPCLNATDVELGVDVLHNPGTQWYRLALDLLKSDENFGRLYLANKGNVRANVTIGMVTDCQYTPGTRVTLPLPASLEINQVLPNLFGKLLQEMAQFEEEYNKVAFKDVYLEITTDQPIHFGWTAEDVTIDDPCMSAVEFDWQNWEVNGYTLKENEDTWYKVNVMYPLKKLRNGETITLTVANPSAVKDVHVDLTMSPTCPVVVSMHKNFTVATKTTVSKEISYEWLKETLKQYVENVDEQELLDKVQDLEIYNKLANLLKKYDKYIPYSQIEAFVEKYEAHLSVEGIKNIVANYEQYLSVAELKQHLLVHKDYIPYEEIVAKLEQYGEYISSKAAQTILSQYDKLLPYAGGAIELLEKCEKYITRENLNKLVDLVKENIPVDEIKALLERIEQRLASAKIYGYVHVVTTGELNINPTLPEEPVCPDAPIEYTVTACDQYEWKGVVLTESGDYYDTTKVGSCADAEWLDYSQAIKLSEFTAPWYKIDVKDIIANESDFTLTFNNDLTSAADLAIELHYYCSEEGDGFIASSSKLVEPGVYTRTMTYEEFDTYIGPEYETLYIHNVNADCDVVEILHLTIEDCSTPCEDVETEFDATFCGQYEWNGVIYTEAGDYVQTLSKTDGCDSIVTLYLTEDCPEDPTPEVPGNPCLDAISFDWLKGAYLTAGDAQWYEMDITSLVENKQHVTLTFTNHSNTTAWVHAVVALDCEGVILPMLLPIPAGLSVDQTIDYQLLLRSPIQRIYVGVYSENADIELQSSVESAIADDQTPCLNATEVQYDVRYVNQPGTSWYKVSTELLKNQSDLTGIYFANKGDKRANVTIGMVADCQYTTGTTITLPIPTGFEVNVMAPNILGQLMQEVEKFEEAINNWDVKEIYVELTTDETVEFELSTRDVNQACDSATVIDWEEWATDGLQLQANQETWYAFNLEYLLETFINDKEITLAVSNTDTVPVDVEMSFSPTCPVVVTLDKAFTVPARMSVKKTLSSDDLIQWLAKYEQYIPYEQIKLFVDKYQDTISVATLKDMLENYEKYLSVEELKQEIAKHKEYVSYEDIVAVLDKYGKYIPYDEAKLLLEKYEFYILYYAGGVAALLEKCEPYITVENFKEVLAYCKQHIPYEELKQLLTALENYALNGYHCYLRVKTTGDLYVGPKPRPIPCEDIVVVDTVEACGSYEWKGVVYDKSGEYSYTQPLADPMDAEFLDWKQPIKLSEFGEPWYKLDISEVIATQSDFTLLLENDYSEPQEVSIELHDQLVEFLVGGVWNVESGIYEKTITYEEFEEIVDPEHTVLYLHNVNFDCERTDVLHLTIINGDTIMPTEYATICEGETYPWHGTNYSIGGTYTAEEALECGTATYTLVLAVENCEIPCEDVETVFSATFCGVYTWNGVEYTEAGDYVKTFHLASGCDSIVTLHLTEDCPEEPVCETVYTEFDAEFCGEYNWNGVIYTEAGDHVRTFTAITGCDSIVTMHLTENCPEEPTCQDVYTEFSTTYCGDFTWNGEVYTQSGDYVQTLTKTDGCDSIVTLHLTILCAETITDLVCDGTAYVDPVTNVEHLISSLVPSTWTWSDTIVSATGNYNIYTYEITPIVAPTALTLETLTTIPGATPVLTAGLVPDLTGTVEAIKAYYEANDTEAISDVVNVYWETAAVACGASTHTMTLVVEDDCDNIVKSAITFELAVVAPVEESATACDSYEWNGVTYTESGDYTYTTTNAYGCDSVVTLHLTINKAVSAEETVIACDSYEWNGTTYTTSGDYTYNGTTVNGCDSVATLHLTINKSVVVEETVIACDSYEWNGTTYTTSGDYTYTGTTVNGCDSVATLHLTINKSVVVEETVAACDSYEWNGTTYTTSGDYTYTGTTVNGCDSVVTLHLTINKSEVVEETVIECDSYTWNGQTYTESGTYTYNTTTAAGCERVETLHLTINKSVAVEETAVACDSYEWNGTTYTTSGDYTYTGTTVNGCDSVVTLHLTINNSAVAEETVVTCDSYEWNGETYTASGDYVFNTNTVAGCDSVVTLHLTILPEAVVENEELVICESEFPYVWRGEVITSTGVYTVVEPYAAADCDSVIHVLNLQTYVMTLPAAIATPVAVCGNAVDVVAATADIEAHIASVSLYAPNAVISWYIQENGAWVALTDVAIPGNVDEVVVKYVIAADCGSVESDAMTIQVEDPNPVNDVDMDNVLAVSKYENRVFLLHLNDFVATYGWTPTPEEVTWYKVVNGLDVYGEVADDVQVGVGHSYNEKDGSIIAAGEYYALIVRKEVTDPADCMTVMRTVVLTSGGAALVPQLVPTIARPNETLTITNLNPEDVTEIKVFSTTGELMATYVAEQVAEFMFNAAYTSGYYMVDVETENGKFTLRYVVK